MNTPEGQISLRIMLPDDVADADVLRALAGWNQLPEDWLRLLQHEPQGCFVAMIENRIVGTVTTTRHQTDLGWIGMMLVHPDFRGRGIARQLMQSALNYLRQSDVRCIMLDATPLGEPVYLKMGFVPDWSFSRWHRTNGSDKDSVVDAQAAVSALPSSWPTNLQQLDRNAFGAERLRWLDRVLPNCLRQSFVNNNDDYGFGLLRSGHSAFYLGPVTASTATAAQQIVDNLLHQLSGPVFWDVPEPNPAAVAMAEARGFQRLRSLTRMRYGDTLISPQLNLQFAICDPATG